MTQAKPTFLGNFQVSIDEKNRVAIPKSLRETLARGYGDESDRVICTVAVGRPAIAVYPASQFYDLLSKLQEATELNVDTQDMLMLLSSRARECPIDRQGRIRLTDDLKQTAGVDREACFCGHFSRMQIWSPERYNEFMKKASDSMSDMTVRAFESMAKR